MVSSLGKRLKAASSAEKWVVNVRISNADGLPAWVQLAEVQLRRGSRRSGRRRLQSSPAVPSADGAAHWGHSFALELTIYKRADGTAVPKPCELIILGAAGEGQKMRKVGSALLDLSEFCSDPQRPRAQTVLLSVTTDCILKVNVSAETMSDCLSCQISCSAAGRTSARCPSTVLQCRKSLSRGARTAPCAMATLRTHSTTRHVPSPTLSQRSGGTHLTMLTLKASTRRRVRQHISTKPTCFASWPPLTPRTWTYRNPPRAADGIGSRERAAVLLPRQCKQQQQ